MSFRKRLDALREARPAHHSDRAGRAAQAPGKPGADPLIRQHPLALLAIEPGRAGETWDGGAQPHVARAPATCQAVRAWATGSR